MRRTLTTLLGAAFSALLGVALVPAPAADPYRPAPERAPPAPPPDPAVLALRTRLNPEFASWSPAYVYERCAEFLATVNKCDRPRIRFLDLSDAPRQELPALTGALFLGVNLAARVTTTLRPRPVPHTDNRVFWLDLCWFNWTPEVWENVSQEDPYYREPLIPSASAALRFLKEETLSNPVLNAGWFLWYTFDNSQFLDLQNNKVFNDRAFYYQLVYANVTFEREAVKDGKKATQKVRGVGPKNAREFQQAWHVDFNVLKDLPSDRGAMVDETRSAVSYQNRVLWRVRAAAGTYWRTFDVFRSVGDQDFVESPFPRQFNAGEHIFQDERGCQFYLLTDGQDNSVDFADPRLVKDDVSGYKVLLVTAKSCVHCHDQGILPFRNEHLVLADIGVKLQAIDPNRAERFRQFYLDRAGMEQRLQEDQRAYARFVKDCNGLSTAEAATQFARARGWYRRPVDLAQAARQHGASVRELADAIGLQGTKGRLGRLVLDGEPIPRDTWERGLYQESGLLLLEWRKRLAREARPQPPPEDG